MSTASFIGAGDFMVSETDPDFMLRHVADIMRAADVTYLNVEGPICDQGEVHAAITGVGIPVRSVPRAAKGLKNAGVDIVSLANNHTMDYGALGLEQTFELLGAQGIAYCGAGRNLVQARRPVSLQVKGLRVSFLSYTSVCLPAYAASRDGHGAAVVRASTSYDVNFRVVMQPGSPLHIRSHANPDDLRMVQEDVRAAKADADVVFVAWHWGVSERHGKVAEYQRELGCAAIDAGADAIVGHHAHMVLGVEFYKQRPIFYSVGNFAFDMSHHYFRPETVVIKCDIECSGLRNFRLLPFMANPARQPCPADERGTQRMAWMLEDLSDGMNTKINCAGREIEISPLTA